MKPKHRIFSLFLFLLAGFGAVLSVIHLLNLFIFSLSGKRNTLNSVWKSEHGDIAFTELGAGPPLLLVHGIGIGAGSSEWDKNIAELSKTRTVYALDLPGFGNSEKRKMSYNSYYYAGIVNEFIAKIIGSKADVTALYASSGFVLAGAALAPDLYNSITVINPYAESMGDKYGENTFVKRILPIPLIGTYVYNYISSKQSILSHIDKTVPADENYPDIEEMAEKRYKNAHRFGTNNKYTVIALLRGYLDTPMFRLMERCPVKLSIIISGDSPIPMLAEREELSIIEINGGALCPNVYCEEFNELL